MHFRQLRAASRILIYGYGAEGKQTQEFLTRRMPKVSLSLYDEVQPDISTTDPLSDFDIIVVSPGVSRSLFAPELHDRLTSATEIFFHNLTEPQRQKIIGVTGTKGKSTTTKLIQDLLTHAGKKVVVGGNFGVPMLSFFDTIGQVDWVVLELSSYQLENLDVSPYIALFTNFYNDHLDRHGTVEAYFAAKSHIFTAQKPGDTTIISNAYQSFLPLFSQAIDSWQSAGVVIQAAPLDAGYFAHDSVFRAPHLLQNFGLVRELALLLDISDDILAQTCREFIGLEHRMEYVTKKFGITFLNDANATTPDASAAAMSFVAAKLGSVIVGGQNRSYDFSPMLMQIERLQPWVIILQSTAGAVIATELAARNYKKVVVVHTMQEIVNRGFELTPRGKVCLLSMGSPSYGHFKNFEEKGTLFKFCVHNR
jgi:UDP-N-acetylmuramoyl-L-alanine---L-glutamate ligase